MVLCVGEILIDMIATIDNNRFFYERKAGGAPFNVSCGIKKFGGKSMFVGAVGDDTVGRYLQGFVQKQQLDDSLVVLNPNRNTTLAFVDLDESGERSFCFYRKNTADYVLPEVPNIMLDKASIIHIGSLMLSEDVGFNYALNLCQQAKEKHKLISFDVNFREDIFKDLAESINRYQKLIEQADIVKLSEDELTYFPFDYLQKILQDKLLCISLGSQGSRVMYNDIDIVIPSIKVKPVDTTGAGDAFYAGILAKISELSKDDWNQENLYEAFRFGNVCGALNTLGKGAIDFLPTIDEIKKCL